MPGCDQSRYRRWLRSAHKRGRSPECGNLLLHHSGVFCRRAGPARHHQGATPNSFHDASANSSIVWEDTVEEARLRFAIRLHPLPKALRLDKKDGGEQPMLDLVPLAGTGTRPSRPENAPLTVSRGQADRARLFQTTQRAVAMDAALLESAAARTRVLSLPLCGICQELTSERLLAGPTGRWSADGAFGGKDEWIPVSFSRLAGIYCDMGRWPRPSRSMSASRRFTRRHSGRGILTAPPRFTTLPVSGHPPLYRHGIWEP
jgi:hypothetical protein